MTDGGQGGLYDREHVPTARAPAVGRGEHLL